MPPLRPVDSSVIAAIGYESALSRLEVHFHTGRVYRYFLVPQSVYDELVEAESVGRYFNRNVRNRYRAEEVR